jgi:hypothetical protein
VPFCQLATAMPHVMLMEVAALATLNAFPQEASDDEPDSLNPLVVHLQTATNTVIVLGGEECVLVLLYVRG